MRHETKEKGIERFTIQDRPLNERQLSCQENVIMELLPEGYLTNIL